MSKSINISKKWDKVIPPRIRKIMDEVSVISKAADAVMDKIRPDGYVAFPKGDIQEGEYYPVYNAGDMLQMFQQGVEFAKKQPWHDGTEIPREEDMDSELFIIVPSVEADCDAFPCFYDKDKEEPWGVMHLPGTNYPVRFARNEVERWAKFNEVLNITKD